MRRRLKMLLECNKYANQEGEYIFVLIMIRGKRTGKIKTNLELIDL